MMKTRWTVALLATTLLLPAVGTRANEQQPTVILPDGRRVTGVSVRAEEDGRILLNTGTATLTFDPGTRVVTPRPRELDRAIQLMQQRQFGEAGAQLRRVVTDYRHLGWDREARKLLARVYLSDNRPAQSVATYEELFELEPEARRDPEDLMRYLKAVEDAGQTAKLLGMLDALVRTAPRSVAAWAQLKRGTAAFEADRFEAALQDFKRTADFFRDQEEFLPEALYRTAVTLRRLNNDAASRYYAELKAAFPNSPFAARPLE